MSELAYIGWSGRGNLGDDAIFDAIASRLRPAAVREVPLYPAELARLALHGGAFRFRHAHPILGGGTVIGRSNWRVHVRTALALARARPAVMIGAGVEDPAFSGTHSFGSPHELARWRGLLERFDRVTVRGPRSQALLADAGIVSDVVGDPALLLEPSGQIEPEDRTLGVALGFGDDLWGHSQQRVVDAVASALKDLEQRKWRIRFFTVNAEDRASAASCARLADLDPAADGLPLHARSAWLPR